MAANTVQFVEFDHDGGDTGIIGSSGTTILRTANSRHSLDDQPAVEIPKPKRARKEQQIKVWEHSHRVTNIEALTPEFYECMECMARFELSDQLLQHLDTHRYFRGPGSAEASHDQNFDCPMCAFSLKKVRDMMSDEEAKIALENHTILEHFKSQLPPILMEAPAKVGDDDDIQEVGRTNISNGVNTGGVFKCQVCPRSFDQLYQRRIHERYHHQESATRSIAELKKTIKCSTCKTLCKSDHQLKLHREMYCNVGFECKQCTDRFSRISLLATHMKLKHGAVTGEKTREIFIPMCTDEENNQSVNSPKIKCPMCGVNQHNAEELVSHLLGRHNYDVTSLKPAMCDKCVFKTSDIRIFTEHYKLHLN
jgi:hypothetical protein